MLDQLTSLLARLEVYAAEQAPVGNDGISGA
jgi:hypothetical protein